MIVLILTQTDAGSDEMIVAGDQVTVTSDS